MYTPAAFRVDDEQRLFGLIETYSFGVLVSGGSTPAISHLPFLLDRQRRCLRTHLARANPHCLQLTEGARATAVFQGPHSYISPAWYAQSDTEPDTVPTWNYTAVHISGAVTPVADEARLRALVEELTDHHESAIAGTWRLAPLTVGQLLPYIAGFEIALDDVQGKFKLGQNRSAADQNGIFRHLRQNTDPMRVALAEMMEPVQLID